MKTAKILAVAITMALAAGSAYAAEMRMGEQQMMLEQISAAIPTEADRQLSERVRFRLLDDTDLQSALSDIQLKTVGGILYIKGTVTTEAEKKAIEERAAMCPGVTQVNNYIEISA